MPMTPNVQAVLSNEDLVGHLLAAMYDHKSMWNLRAAECFSGPEVIAEERRGLQTRGRIKMLARRAKRWCAVLIFVDFSMGFTLLRLASFVFRGSHSLPTTR